MNRLHVPTLLCLALGISCAVSAVQAADKVKKARPVQGTVTEIVAKENGDSSLIVKIRPRKKDTATTEGTEKQFIITKSTKIEQITGKKGQVESRKAEIGDLKKNAQIVVTTASNGNVEKITIQPQGKKKTKT